MKSLREVMDAQDWSTWSATPRCVQEMATSRESCDNVDGAEVRREVDMGSIGEDHVALKRRAAGLEDLLRQARATEKAMRHAASDAEARATAAERELGLWRASTGASAPEHAQQALTNLREDLTQAERARDEARAALSEAMAGWDKTTIEHADEIAARERAEADNAALLEQFLDVSMRIAQLSASATPLAAAFRETLEQLAGDLQRMRLQMRGYTGGHRHPGAALLERLREMKRIGAMMSNACFNLKQEAGEGRALSIETRTSLAQCQAAWDALVVKR
jgi:chromosome segregation ATPase